jgi:hypothetical protein
MKNEKINPIRTISRAVIFVNRVPKRLCMPLVRRLKTLPGEPERAFGQYLRLRAASAFFLRFTLGFS